MYRDPRRFSQADSDDLLYVNLVRCGNPNPIKISEVVQVAGTIAYLGHKWRQDQGLYDVFTPAFYAENLKILQNRNMPSNIIETSKLESLLKEGISFLTDIIAKGKRITNSQVDSHNQRLKEIMAELVNIAKQIEALNVSDEEKKRIGENALAKVKELMSQFADLNERAKSLGLVHEATSEQKRVFVNDALETLTETPREVENAKASSAKATDASQLHTITAEEAIRLLRDD